MLRSEIIKKLNKNKKFSKNSIRFFKPFFPSPGIEIACRNEYVSFGMNFKEELYKDIKIELKRMGIKSSKLQMNNSGNIIFVWKNSNEIAWALDNES